MFRRVLFRSAAARLAAAREAVGALAATHRLPVENLLSPDALRRLAWEPPAPATTETITAALRASGARRWQAELTAGLLAEAFASAAEHDASAAEDDASAAEHDDEGLLAP